MSVLTLIAMVCYLLFGTSITIKGVLPLDSKKPTNEDVETPLLESNTSTMEATSSTQAKETTEDNNASRSTIPPEERNASDDSRQEKDDIEVAKQRIIEAWKVTSCVR